MLLSIWSRTWIGWWSLLPVGAVVAWLFVNPRVFPPVREPRSWAARGIYGERAWVQDRDLVPPDHRKVLRLLVALGVIGFGMIFWGLIALEVWPTVFGATVVVVAQLWRIDRFGWLWERRRAPGPDRRCGRGCQPGISRARPPEPPQPITNRLAGSLPRGLFPPRRRR
ncbi:hypothetical protein GCM10022267_85230 [Lentzea roselyniae]|uniref:SdpI/YhfL protein family protein n=2 Tax=Lentzea roselyniae TaxID=531940 RepID=A0ABP7CDH1_9PSEU